MNLFEYLQKLPLIDQIELGLIVFLLLALTLKGK